MKRKREREGILDIVYDSSVEGEGPKLLKSREM
jgi:hypothetical protein